MESKLIYKNEELELCEDFIDVGYMAENFEAHDFYDNIIEVKRSNIERSMTILFSFPDASNGFLQEILKLDKFLSAIEVDINCYLIFDKEHENMAPLKNNLNKLIIIYDTENEYGSMYGTQIVSGTLENKLTKALFLISKDGAVFYLEMPNDLEKEFNIDRLRVELNKAYVSYTGVGCHG